MATRSYKDYAEARQRNFTRNPSFDIWQRGVSFAGVDYIADCWKAGTSADRTYSRQAGFSGARYCLRVQRDSGNSSTGLVQAAFVIPSINARHFAGKNLTLSFDIRAGADFSAASSIVLVAVTVGTGEDEVYTPGTSTFPTGSFNTPNNVTITTTAQRLHVVVPVGSTRTEIGCKFAFTPVGTAGAADYFEVTNVKTEIGNGPTPWAPEPRSAILQDCFGVYWKTFDLDTTPAQNVGVGTGEFCFAATIAGANVNVSPSIELPVPMIHTPVATLFNPAAANAEVRDKDAPADCSSSSVVNLTKRGGQISTTANASTTQGGNLGVHAVFDGCGF